MLTNQDRRAILEQVKASDSGDIIAALRGQVSTEPMQNPAPTQEPVNIPQSPQPIDVDLETTSTLPSNLVDSTAAEPTQLAKEGGVKSRDGSTYVVNKEAVITDPVRNTEYFSKTPMYEGHPHSTHLMSDDDKLTAWPSIFQDEEGNWFKGNAKEAKKRGELYKFDTRKEMIDFARKGNWKNEMNTKKAMGGFGDFPHMIDNEEGAPWEVKKGLRKVESSDGINMINPTSTATGLYGQLYSEIKDLPLLKDVSREQFAADTTLQNAVLDMRWKGEIPEVPGLKDNAEYLSKRYSDVNKDLTFNEIAAMSNLTGRQGAIDYFRSLRHGTEFKLPGKNKTPSEYIDSYRGAFKKETGGFNFNNTRDFSQQAIEQRQQNRELNVDNLELIGSFAPYLGEAIDAKNTLKSLKQGEYGNAALHAAGFMLPFIPGNALVKGAKKLFGKADELIPMATKKVGDYGISKTGFNKYMKYKIPPAKYNTNIINAPENTYRAVRNPLRDGEIDLNFMQGTVNPIKGNTPITTKQLAIDKSLELNPNIYDHGSKYNVGMSTTTNKADVENYFRYRLKDHTDGYYKTRKGINPYMKGITKWDLTYGLNPNQKLLNSSDYRVFMGEQAKRGISGTKIQAGILEDLGYTGIKKFPDSDELQFLDPKKSLFLKNIKQVDNFKKGGKIKGSDGRACWDGYRYAGMENGKDKCVPYEYGGFKKKCKYGCW